jgi:hypothetical protein
MYLKGHAAMPIPPDFRVASPTLTRFQQLGPLGELPGTWAGHGFNLIARPDFQGGNDIFLELNPTDEHLQFSAIGGAIPNRGSVQDDIEIFGIHYLQQISDNSSGGAIHIEPGLWLHVPQTTDPVQQPTVVRLATIPHGTAVLGQGSSFAVNGPPEIRPANTVPFSVGGTEPGPGAPNPFPEYDLSNQNTFRTTPTPGGVTQELVTNPNSLLVADIAGQTITETVVLTVFSVPPPGITTFGPGAEDIPFLGPNATVGQFRAIFWIETVQYRDQHFLQLQYTQTVLLNFADLSWPHVSVATLRKVT